MTRNVIYFPEIKIPNNQWFNQVLLYWNDVYSIAPSDISFFGDHMDALLNEGLVKVLKPYDYLSECHDTSFMDLFLEYVKNPDYPIKANSISRDNYKFTPIFYEKMNNDLFDMAKELHKIGYALSPRRTIVEIEEHTANLYMSYLAAFIGSFPEIQATPMTDHPIQLNPYGYSNIRHQEINNEKDQIRKIILNNILPAPKEDVTAKEIRKFKEKHFDELMDFRSNIEREIHDLLKERDIAYRNAILNDYLEESKDRINEISTQMSSIGWKNLSLGNWLTIAQVGLDLVSSIHNPIGMAKAAINGIRTFNDLREYLNTTQQRDFAYAVYCKKELSA